MRAKPLQPCPHRERTEALVSAALQGQERRAAERHLEVCDLCRGHFRQSTAEQFPRFKSYTIVERVGKGGFGVVYKAIHHSKQRTEALKVHFGKTEIRTAYFENEVHLIARLQHPNIATLYEAHLTGEPLYYTMEFVEGAPIDKYFRESNTPLLQRIEILKAVAGALHYAHERGIVHRDMKPQNILIDAAGRPHIVDFGIAKRLGIEAEAEPPPAPGGREGAVGTFGYIAPEQLAGQPIDGRADIYALGVLLFHCLTGEPARLASRATRLDALLRARHVGRAEDLAAIIARCVENVPEKRYASCAALITDLDNYLEGRPVQARSDWPWWYFPLRVAAWSLRHHPYAARTGIVSLVAVFLTLMFNRLTLGVYPQTDERGEVVLVACTLRTLEALQAGQAPFTAGVDARDRPSWRRLYGRLLERIGQARPRAVVWDYYFPDEFPQHDPEFIAGIRTVRAPVIIGAAEFDVNGEPQIAPSIRAAVAGWGMLWSTNPLDYSHEYRMPVCVQRGFAPLIPSLALAGCAAARFPDSVPELRRKPDVLEVGYRRRDAAQAAPRWHDTIHTIPIAVTHKLAASEGALLAGDELLYRRVPATALDQRVDDVVDFVDVLGAERRQLGTWFDGKVVLVGQMIPPVDYHRLQNGAAIFGCQIQRRGLETLLSDAHHQVLERTSVALRVVAWCALAAVVAGLLRRIGADLPLARVSLICAVGVAAGFLAGASTAGRFQAWWLVELLIALASLLAAGFAAWWAVAVREQQLRLTPGAGWSVEDSTLSTVAMAETRL